MKTVWLLAFTSVMSRRLHSVLSVIAVASGIALLCALYLLGQGLERRIERSAGKVDVIAGAKGSPLQLVLSTLYHADIPTGNIDMKDFAALSRHPLVRQAIPLAVGDAYHGWRVVGTTADYIGLYGADVDRGRIFSAPFEVVAGAATGLKPGMSFYASHGFSADESDVHKAHAYTVVGVLGHSGTVLDRLLMTPLESVQQLHAHHDHDEGLHEDHHEDGHGHEEDDHGHEGEEGAEHQLTAVLIKTRSAAAVLNLPRQINTSDTVMAAVPSYEIARFLKSVGVGKDVVTALSLALVVLAGLMLFSGLSSGLLQRRHDMAVLRVMGASPALLFATMMCEGLFVGGLGAVLGVMAAHGIALMAASQISALSGLIEPSGFLIIQLEDFYFVGLGLLIGMISALLPAVSAARTDIASLLARNS